jgi:hypothetical protein
MALRRAKIQPTLQEKRYITLQLLESAYMSGNRVLIHPVSSYSLSTLAKENFTYEDPVETYIIYDERPKVHLLKKLGWFREDEENLPQIAYIPTHLLYSKYGWDNGSEVSLGEVTSPTLGDRWYNSLEGLLYTYDGSSWDDGVEVPIERYIPSSVGEYYIDPLESTIYTSIAKKDIVNEVLLEGDEFQDLVEQGESTSYKLEELKIKRGTLIDVFYDFAPDVDDTGEYDLGEFNSDQDSLIDAGEFGEPQPTQIDLNKDRNPYDFPIDQSVTINRFYVTESRMDTVSINYTCKLMAYKYQAEGEAEEDQNISNGPFLNFKSDEHGA